jgi:tRNA A-37 threonylcarbamoyl transferase component Bud32
MAIVSKSVFEKDARVGGKVVGLGDIWPVDRYNSTTKPFQALKSGGRIWLVTVRPPNEQLWFVGCVESPKFTGTSWASTSKNSLPITNITPLRKTLKFETGKGMSQDKGTLGMSLQTPRVMTPSDVAQVLAVIKGGPAPPPSADPDSHEKPLRVIDGKYEILRQLGQGGMGTVYEARHTNTGRYVALKEIVGDDDLRNNPQILERFQREARAMGAIDTPHIAPVLDSGKDASTDHPYLVMELVKGEDLQQLLARLGPLPEDLALRITCQACRGLMHAHEAGVVHRDIKPANLFLARNREKEIVVKLLDFGIARVRDQIAPQNFTLTTTGSMLGSPLYMSPEQALGKKTLDHRTDLWSLGIVFFEMLTGKTPHDDPETLGALILSICSQPARGVRTNAPHVSERTEAIVRKMIEIDPQKRYATAEACLEDLENELPEGSALDESMLMPLPDAERMAVEEIDAAGIEIAATTPVGRTKR